MFTFYSTRIANSDTNRNAMLSLLFIAISLISVPSYSSDNYTRIIGGEKTTADSNPWIVALVASDLSTKLSEAHFCGGTIIDKYWVLTAAHCMYKPNGEPLKPFEIKIASGITNLFTDRSVDEGIVSNIVIHPSYNNLNPDVINDIALIELDSAMRMSSLPMYKGGTNALLGLDAKVAGWGAIDFSNPEQPIFTSTLQEAIVPVVPQSYCNLPESYDGDINLGQVCAGYVEGVVDSCVGDSGGPLTAFVNGVEVLIGIVSFGDSCAEPFKYGVYTNSSRYQDWIAAYTSGELLAINLNKPYNLRGSDIESSGAISQLGIFLLAMFLIRRKISL